MKLIDTTIAVDHLRGEPAAAVLLAELINNGEEIAASELVRFELLAGVRESELAALEAFFSAVVWTLVTEDVPGSADDSPVDTGPATAVSTTWTT